ncbi:hypothetical protein AAFF_G00233980 [Aldrovandia affinis]|uniref:Uncharacterized protein n=1 Tax=Aldrovandia affinis TaxID=143900 RepID=A0AAD7W3H1_9TELE|nr:hypothetical protein AAFF_G00233980 [Aldrovandia affinis]
MASGRASNPSPSPSPSYDLPPRPADTRLVPGLLPPPGACEGLSDRAFHPETLARPPGAAPPYLPPPTPDPCPAPRETPVPYSEREREEISVLARQISSLASSFDMYRSTGAPGNKTPFPPDDPPPQPSPGPAPPASRSNPSCSWTRP